MSSIFREKKKKKDNSEHIMKETVRGGLGSSAAAVSCYDRNEFGFAF